MTLRNEKIQKFATRSTRSHYVKNSHWKMLWTYCKTACGMDDCVISIENDGLADITK